VGNKFNVFYQVKWQEMFKASTTHDNMIRKVKFKSQIMNNSASMLTSRGASTVYILTKESQANIEEA
jgi:hypothetical protein